MTEFPSWLERVRAIVSDPQENLSKDAVQKINGTIDDLETVHNCEQVVRSSLHRGNDLIDATEKLKGKLLFDFVDAIFESGLLEKDNSRT